MKKLFTILSLLASTYTLFGANPYLPLWEHIPDGEPYVFDDPDRPGHKRVYIYGSHDMLRDQYCGTDQVVWSASPDSLDHWRYDGVIFTSRHNALGKALRKDSVGDVLYAPDITMRPDRDGNPIYYLYPNNQAWKRQSMVARSRRPDGPFEVFNWSDERSDSTVGILGFDPAVFVDDDGRVYGYWGFGQSMGAELDPETMATVRPGTEIIENMISGYRSPGVFRFFEASSMRKIEDKYVFIYSRMSANGEWGLPESNYTLAYAYSDSPLGPFTYGGTLVDCRGRDTDASGNVIATATPVGNTHGSLCKIGDQWWLFFHRQTGLDEFSRQAMVAPVKVAVTPGAKGKVDISEAEYTSEGFEIEGLNPLKLYPAAIASHFTGSQPAYQIKYPQMRYFGPYFDPIHLSADSIISVGRSPYDDIINYNPVVNLTSGSILGYKYFNFSTLGESENPTLHLTLIPSGISGSISIFTSAPWKTDSPLIGKVNISPQTHNISEKLIDLTIQCHGIKGLSGKHPLYIVFTSDHAETSMGKLLYLQFTKY